MLFLEGETQIFGPYFVNGEPRYADPLMVQEQLWALLDGDANQFLRAARSEDARVRWHAWQRLAQAVPQAFGLPPFDPATGQGTTLRECRLLLDGFLDWCEELKKKLDISPISSPPTAPSLGPSTTGLTSDCGCK